MTEHAERARQWVHIGSGAFALLLRWLNWWQTALLALTALAFNALVLPRVGGRRLYRPVDHARGFPIGILLYPIAVLLLVLAFPSRPDIAAAAWGILAIGDGAATLVGRGSTITLELAKRAERDFSPSSKLIVRRVLPWNADKSLAGTLAFIVLGGAGSVALAWWTRVNVTPAPPLAFTIVAPLVAATVAGLVESIPVGLDDNISVPATAGVVLWLASLMTMAATSASREAMIAALPWAIAVNALTAFAGYRAKSVSASGAIGGMAIGAVIYACAGGGGWTLLLVTFLLASVSSRLGLRRKTLLGIAEERGGRRGAGNAVANCGVATLAAIAAATTPHASLARLALVAALTAGGSDTVASEIGKAWGRSTFLITTFGRVPPGTTGAMSVEGTVAGLVSALALAAVGVWLGLTPAFAIPAIVAGATAGALVESALGATLEGPGILNNDMLNFINTAVAAVVTIILTSTLSPTLA
jgi:uncharacterized protein (TIGR00297 family)